MARQVQDMSGGYLDITDADETAGRVMQDMGGGYIHATSAGADEESALSGSALTGGTGTHAPSHTIPL